MAIFHMARLTGITVNMKTGEISIGLKVKLNDDNYEKAESLKNYLDAKSGGLTVDIRSRQLPLPLPMPEKQ